MRLTGLRSSSMMSTASVVQIAIPALLLHRLALVRSAGLEGFEGLPSQSILLPWRDPSYGPDYYRLRNVKLVGEQLMFFNNSKMVKSEEYKLPAEIILNKDEAEIPLKIHQVPMSNEPNCRKFYTEPAVLIAGTPWDSNLYEMMLNVVLPLWGTLAQEGLIDPDRYLSTKLPPENNTNAFLMIQARLDTYESQWSYLFDYMTPKQVLLSQVDDCCFSDLTIISDAILRYLTPKGFATLTEEAQYNVKKRQLLKEFKRWVKLVEGLYRRSQGMPKPGKLPDSANYTRPRVIFSSRPVRAGHQSRGITNELEIVEFIEEQYDVNVTLLDFKGPLEDAIQLVESSSLLLGMHGAGLTNALWLQPGSHFLQLAPYGFDLEGSRLIRGEYFMMLARDTGSTASHWANPHAHKSFFHKEHFGEKDGAYFSQPTEDTPKPVDWNPPNYWIYQTTEVDVDSFSPALDHAMRMINVPKRAFSS